VVIDVSNFISPAFKALQYIRSCWLGRRGILTPAQILEAQRRWRPEVEAELRLRRRKEVGMDVIVRDVKRLDDYMSSKQVKDKRISGWFRAGLVGTYHGGIKVLIGWYELKQSDMGAWRFVDRDNGETGDLTCGLVGYVPYEQIEHIDWEGDEFYGMPVLYC
jgi:hypothetical protein